MLARLMSLDELACVGKSMEHVQVLQFIYNGSVWTRFLNWKNLFCFVMSVVLCKKHPLGTSALPQNEV